MRLEVKDKGRAIQIIHPEDRSQCVGFTTAKESQQNPNTVKAPVGREAQHNTPHVNSLVKAVIHSHF